MLFPQDRQALRAVRLPAMAALDAGVCTRHNDEVDVAVRHVDHGCEDLRQQEVLTPMVAESTKWLACRTCDNPDGLSALLVASTVARALRTLDPLHSVRKDLDGTPAGIDKATRVLAHLIWTLPDLADEFYLFGPHPSPAHRQWLDRYRTQTYRTLQQARNLFRAQLEATQGIDLSHWRYAFVEDATWQLNTGGMTKPLMPALIAYDWVAQCPNMSWVLLRLPAHYAERLRATTRRRNALLLQDLGPADDRTGEQTLAQLFTAAYRPDGVDATEVWRTVQTVAHPGT